ncbi:ABC transporter substrate-binding protein [Boudabousia tangfeifanii]|uniref:ABC transporter substrate-binding protein n=1 Tax=Boudabousia tangfeifanii TaxID=1912795 RepID=A0A1D9MJW1_9ACTO|nr:sugar ABC transporter substrate-binding protein [Boudabousia tangfeifanii]AOZ72572.1 ABC transporter substrate-binding protein [Boudabousia tangfeifanii]
MKRKIALVMSLALASGALAACGSSDNNSEAGGGKMDKIELWMPTLANDNQDKQLWQEISQKFEKENNVKVNVTIVPWSDYETKFLTGVTSGKGPDVGFMYPEMMGDYIEKAQIEPLDSFVTEDQKKNLLFLDNGVVDGKQYALPLLVGGARVMFYNKALLAKAGVDKLPETWDDFVAVGEKLKGAGIAPWISDFADKSRGVMNSNFFPFIWQAGGRLFAEDGKKTEFDSPEVIKAATYLKTLLDKGVLDSTSTGATTESARKSFQNGKSAFIFENSAKASLWKESNIDYGYIVSLKDKQRGTFFASNSLVLFKGCQDKDLCYKFMDYLTQGDQMAKFHTKAPFFPVGKDEKGDPNDEFAKVYTEDKDALHTLPVVPRSVGTYQVLYKNLQSMLAGAKSPEQAMKDAAAEGNKILSK